VDEYIESGGLYEWEPTRLTIPLLGYHQVENAATAYAALQSVRTRGLAIDENAIRKDWARYSGQGGLKKYFSDFTTSGDRLCT